MDAMKHTSTIDQVTHAFCAGQVLEFSTNDCGLATRNAKMNKKNYDL